MEEELLRVVVQAAALGTANVGPIFSPTLHRQRLDTVEHKERERERDRINLQSGQQHRKECEGDRNVPRGEVAQMYGFGKALFVRSLSPRGGQQSQDIRAAALQGSCDHGFVHACENK